MGQHLAVVIGPSRVIGRLAPAAGNPPLTELPQGMAIAPLGEEQIDTITALQPGPYAEGFVYLSDALQRFLSSFSDDGALAYLEADYFGGKGAQAAAVFSRGEMVLRLALPIGHAAAGRYDPINSALRAIGVSADEGQDAFDTLDLGRFRSLESLGLGEE